MYKRGRRNAAVQCRPPDRSRARRSTGPHAGSVTEDDADFRGFSVLRFSITQDSVATRLGCNNGYLST